MAELAIHSAAYAGNLEQLARCLADGAAIDARNEFGHTPLMLAACFSLPATKLLLSRGADPTAVDRDGRTALHNAVRWGNHATVELLVAHGVDPAVVDAPDNALARAALATGSRVMVERLWRAGARFDRVSSDGWTTGEATLLRGGAGSSLAVELGLLAVDREIEGRSAWWYAIANRDVTTLVSLAAHYGADPKRRGPGGESCLHVAIRARDHRAVAHLIELGGDVHAVTEAGATLWCQANGTGDSDLIAMMAARRGDSVIAGSRPLDWGWDVGGNGPHVALTMHAPTGSGPELDYCCGYNEPQRLVENDHGLAIIRYWGNAGEPHHDAIRHFLQLHPAIEWSIDAGGEGYSPVVIARGHGARTLAAYLNLW